MATKIDVVFDMETGDPDDLITLVMLLLNPLVNLKGVTCWGGSPIQTGLITHVMSLAGKTVPIGGDASATPLALDDYYHRTVGDWRAVPALKTPVEVLHDTLSPTTQLLTGAPLTNVAAYLNSGGAIGNMTTQGGYLGRLVPVRLDKFKKRDAVPTYNLGNDLDAFNVINTSKAINKVTFVTKDLCHGFLYGAELHQNVQFGKHPLGQLLSRCLGHYADAKKMKAMHDPLAMLTMLYPELGTVIPVRMSYTVVNDRPLFSSFEDTDATTYGLVAYDQKAAWETFKQICEY